MRIIMDAIFFIATEEGFTITAVRQEDESFFVSRDDGIGLTHSQADRAISLILKPFIGSDTRPLGVSGKSARDHILELGLKQLRREHGV